MSFLQLIKKTIYPKKYKIKNESINDDIDYKINNDSNYDIDDIYSNINNIDSKSNDSESKSNDTYSKSNDTYSKSNDSDYKSNDTYYKIDYTKLSQNLLDYFDTNIDTINNIYIDWTPPNINGLDNSDIIIPQYNFNNSKSILAIDYFDIIIDNIRNLRKLNKYQLEYIKTLNDDSKHILFLEFNKLFDNIELLLNKIN